MKRKNYNLMIGGAITLFFLAVALIGQFWTPYGTTTMDSMAVNLAPCAAHPPGTDNFGRDILSRVMAGSGSTYFVAVCTVLIGCVFGTIVGALTGHFGGFDNLIIVSMISFIVPSILLALIFISPDGQGLHNIILALGILFIPSFARIVRSEVIRCRELDFCQECGSWRRASGLFSPIFCRMRRQPLTAARSDLTMRLAEARAELSDWESNRRSRVSGECCTKRSRTCSMRRGTRSDRA